MNRQLFTQQAHPSWSEVLLDALEEMDQAYLQSLRDTPDFLPGLQHLFAAFQLPLTSTAYILLGESPYPRAQSANGYAFWDAAVGSLWSPTGLSKEVNRATSLRNLLKMLLYARGDMCEDFSQPAIAQLDKSPYVQTVEQLFNAFIRKGFLLLNASLVYREGQVPYHARQWRPFIYRLFCFVAQLNPSIQLILWGKIAEQVPESGLSSCLVAEHPYNLSFITNPKVVAFFKPFDLLHRQEDPNDH